MKNPRGIVICLVVGLLCLSLGDGNARAQKADGPKLGKASIRAVIAAMTLEEKAALAVGVSSRDSALRPEPGLPASRHLLPPFPRFWPTNRAI